MSPYFLPHRKFSTVTICPEILPVATGLRVPSDMLGPSNLLSSAAHQHSKSLLSSWKQLNSFTLKNLGFACKLAKKKKKKRQDRGSPFSTTQPHRSILSIKESFISNTHAVLSLNDRNWTLIFFFTKVHFFLSATLPHDPIKLYQDKCHQ